MASESTGIQKILINMGLTLASLLVMLLLIEGYFWVTYESKNLYKDLVGYHKHVETAHFTPPLNEDGFREDEISSDIMGNQTTRILFLGDSFTYGYGLPEGEKRFSDLIEKRLQSLDDKRNYHIYNAGIGGTEPTRWVGYLATLLPKYKPDIVYAIFFLRDGTSMGTSLSGHLEKIKELNKKYTQNILYRMSAIARIAIDKLMIDEFNRYYQNIYFTAYLGNNEQTAVWQKEQESIKTLLQMCKREKIDLHLIIFPALFELRNYPYANVENEISRFAHSQNIPVMSLIRGFAGQNEQELWNSLMDQHPNEKGHQIASDTLYPYVEQTLGLEK